MRSKYKFPNRTRYALYFTLATALFLLSESGCQKFITVIPPTNEVTAATVYNDNGTAASVLTGIYDNLSSGGFTTGGLVSTPFFAGLSADELTLFNAVAPSEPTAVDYYTNQLTSSNDEFSSFWYQVYPQIFVTNAAVEGLGKSTGLTPAVKQQLMGEAKFMRAFCYFYLVNFYGDVPLVISTDYNVTKSLSRTSKDSVWRQIISDLQDAQNLLSPNYLDATVLNTTTERIRPTKWAATAMLARAYLYTGNWAGADSAATAVINNTAQYSLTSLNNVFLTNSQEAIWQLQGVSPYANTQEGQTLIFPQGIGPNWMNYVYLSKNLVNSFEPGDQRKTDWVDSMTVADTVSFYGSYYYGGGTYYYAYKYKIAGSTGGKIPQTEYLTVLRLAEQYLIRSEARVRQGDIAGAQEDLNMIRDRAGLPNTTASDEASLLAAISHERQVELFCEWGDRWLDLKRTGAVDSVMSVVCPQKGGTWNTYKQWYPVPLYEIQQDARLVQTPGY